jgi:hypothetical protein
MGDDCRASGGSWQCNTPCLTATPSAAGRLPLPLRSVTSCLLELLGIPRVHGRRWLDKASVQCAWQNGEAHLYRKDPACSTVPAPPQPCKPRRLASKSRRGARDRRRRGVG